MISTNKHILGSVILLLATIALFEITPLDILVQDYFYNTGTQQWILDRDEKVTRFLFYDGIKVVFILFTLSLPVLLLLFRKKNWMRDYRRGLWIVLLSCCLVPLLIGGLKASTNTPCPKNLVHYGGDYPYVGVLERYPPGFRQPARIQCYPAGHASGGFALLSLFFLFRSRKNRLIALTTAMIIGWSIGTYKMIIGDHFLSHTLVTMLLAWLTITLVVKAFELIPPGSELDHSSQTSASI